MLLSSFIPKSSYFSQKEPDEVRKVLKKSVQTDQDTDFIVFSLFSLAGTPNKVANCYQQQLVKNVRGIRMFLSSSQNFYFKSLLSLIQPTKLCFGVKHSSRIRKIYVVYRNTENKKSDFLFGLFQKKAYIYHRCKTISCIWVPGLFTVFFATLDCFILDNSNSSSITF